MEKGVPSASLLSCRPCTDVAGAMPSSRSSFRQVRARLARRMKRQLIVGLNKKAISEHPLATRLAIEIVELILEQLAAVKIGAYVRGKAARRMFRSMHHGLRA